MADATDILRVLAVGCRVSGQDGRIAVVEVASAILALAALRTADFDLMLTTLALGDEPIYRLVRDVRRVRPKLRWWLIAQGLPADQEVLARTLSVTRILLGPPTAGELAAQAPRRLTPPPGSTLGMLPELAY